jgi:hypothetical protein
MVKINIKKYSRSNVNEPDPADTEASVDYTDTISAPKRRGRPKKVTILDQQVDDEPAEPQLEPVLEPQSYEFEPLEAENEDISNDPFLDDLNNENFQEPPSEKEQKLQEKEFKEQAKIHKKNQLKEQKVNSIFETSDLFDETGTEIIGRDRRVIINKLNQYRSLFPKELSKFKVKKGASIDELQAYLQEMSTIVECSSYDNFLSDSIIQTVKLIEGATQPTRYDISGCADMLKANPQFNYLLKQLYVKYNVFSKIPPEIQMVLLVSTTAYICINKNKNKASLTNYLNTPMQ